MEKKLTIDVEALKRSLLLRRPMKARFKLPMSEDEAYAYLLAAMMAEVEYRHRSFCTSEDMENQLHEISSLAYLIITQIRYATMQWLR